MENIKALEWCKAVREGRELHPRPVCPDCLKEAMECLLMEWRRDPRALDYGLYAIIDPDTGHPMVRWGSGHYGVDENGYPALERSIYSLTLEEAEEWLR